MMILKVTCILLLSIDISLVSSYTIPQSRSTIAFTTTLATRRVHPRMPTLTLHQPSVCRQRGTIVSLTASSSETQSELDIPTTPDATASTSNSNSTSENVSSTRKMRVSELKKALDEWKVKYDDCFDQESLLARYNEAVLMRQQDVTPATTTTTTTPPTSAKSKVVPNMEQHNEEMLQSIRQMSVKELREELGQRCISRVGLLEKSDLVRAVYDARMVAQAFSVTGLLQPYKVTGVTGDQLQKEIENHQNIVTTPLLVDVYATWCGPCQLMSKQLLEVADELGDTIRIVKLDSDQYPDISSQLRIQGLPTIILYSTSGTEIKRIEGAMMKDQLIQWIHQQLQSQKQV
jgi:thioredoxin 1